MAKSATAAKTPTVVSAHTTTRKIYRRSSWKACDDAFGGPVLSNQVRFSLVHRSPETQLLPWAQSEGRVVIAYSPLGQGLLSGRYLDQAPTNFRRFLPDFRGSNRSKVAPLVAALGEIAERHGATRSQVALAWLVRKPNVVAIPGASSLRQVEENASAADLQLSDDESERLGSLPGLG